MTPPNSHSPTLQSGLWKPLWLLDEEDRATIVHECWPAGNHLWMAEVCSECRRDIQTDRLTTTSARALKSVHNVPASQLLTRNLVFPFLCKCARPASSLSGFASHLHISLSHQSVNILKEKNVLRTPPLHDSGKPHLLRVIHDVWSESIYDTSKVAIRTFHNFGDWHPRFEWFEDLGQTHMVHLPTEDLILCTFPVLLSCY